MILGKNLYFKIFIEMCFQPILAHDFLTIHNIFGILYRLYPRIRLLYAIKNKAAISLPFNLNGQSIAALFLFLIVDLFEDMAHLDY